MTEAREDRPGQEDDDGGLEEPLASVLVAELAPQWCGDRRCQQIGDDDPREVRGPVQVGNDRRQRRRDDGLVERRQEQAKQQSEDDDEDAAVTESRYRCQVGRSGPVAERGRAAVGRGTWLVRHPNL